MQTDSCPSKLVVYKPHEIDEQSQAYIKELDFSTITWSNTGNGAKWSITSQTISNHLMCLDKL